jgi:predicted nucleic acid-binding protein
MIVYPDSMLWVYFFEQNPQSYASTHAFMTRAQAGRYQFASSYLVLAEVLVIPKRNGDLFTAARYRRTFHPSRVTMVPLSPDVAERFADIRAITRVKPADALHLALAASAGTDYFVTTDTNLHSLNIPGIAHICPPDHVP